MGCMKKGLAALNDEKIKLDRMKFSTCVAVNEL